MIEKIPIFPLNTVLFPGMPLLIHIFELRYRLMLDHCLDESLPLGIFLIKDGMEAHGPVAEPYSIGTLARIRSVHRHNDGRSHIELIGETRIRLHSQETHSDGYLTGNCERLDEDLSEMPSDQESMLFEYRLRRLLEINTMIPLDPLLLCHSAIRLLDLPLPLKQCLLEMDRFLDRWKETERRLQEKLEYRMLAEKLGQESNGDSTGPSLN
jgi:ATP-dependent Lon protease